MSAQLLQELLEQSAERYVCNCAKSFLEGRHSFRWITGMISRCGFSKQDTTNILLPLRNYGDTYRAEALFNWLAKREW